MTVETEEQLEKLKAIGRIVGTVLKRMLQAVEPGMTTLELDLLGRDWLAEAGAQSAPKVTYDFPGFTCISVNEEAAHGIPGERKIMAGDIVNIDVSAEKDGFFGDTGGTIVVPPISPLKKRLCFSTEVALKAAIQAARAGQPLNQIGKAIQTTAKKKGFKIIRNLCSHGVGLSLHEYPKEILPYYDPRERRILKKGMVITIEPFLSTKSQYVKEAPDGWTLISGVGNFSAQFEHSMVITEGAPILLTAV